MKKTDFRNFTRWLNNRGFTQVELDLNDEKYDKGISVKLISPRDELMMFTLSTWNYGNAKLTVFHKTEVTTLGGHRPEYSIQIGHDGMSLADDVIFDEHHITNEIAKKTFDLLWTMLKLSQAHGASQVADATTPN